MAKRVAKKAKAPVAKAAPVVRSPLSTTEYSALTKAQIISELTKSPHGDLQQFVPIGRTAAQVDGEFLARLVAWNQINGQIRDSKVALPILSLTVGGDQELTENALAHVAMLSPRDLIRALEFSKDLGNTPRNTLKRLVERYLRDREAHLGVWEKTAVQHRAALHRLYARYHIKPASFADIGIFKNAAEAGRLAVVKTLATLDASLIAGTISQYKLPFLIVRGALGARAKEPDVLQALVTAMTPTELVTNMKALEKLGVKDHGATRAALDNALTAAGSSKRAAKATLKTTQAAEAQEDEGLKQKLRVLQEKQIDNLKGIEGNWLVLGDKSGSMAAAIEGARQVAGQLARFVKGKVYLVFFDSHPTFYDVTGKTLEEITTITKRIGASGQTSIGCGLQALLEKNLQVEGIAVVTDGGENTSPYFYQVYKKYAEKLGVEPTVYCYATSGYSTHFEQMTRGAGIDMTVIDISKADYYSLPNLVQTMRTGRYGLYDEVMATPFVTLDQVLERTKGLVVIPGQLVAV
jgi:hypothetical protein